ncbi:hypothetical protein [Nocardioides cynanchi]|uniref:hypothetical protein n=1 Tax=Nocardioides cynanchi TaxID=2558918 RepID=UPI0012457F91|nr:hypothetical protein [Nocardioides cynanchi]
MDGLLGAIIGLAVAAVLAIINAMLSDRQKVAEGVRDQRIRTYPAAWERTGVVSRWPHTDADRGHALRLHRDLRTWYYSGGGLFLSEDARERYEHFQVVLEAIVAQDPAHPIEEYDDLVEAAHWFRLGLAEDLRIRHQGMIAAWRAKRMRRAEAAEAVAREQRVGARVYASHGATRRPTPEAAGRVALTDDDERLHLPPPPADA